MNQAFYIPPFLRIETDISTYLQNRKEHNSYLPDTLDLENLVKKRALILGEPGFGKSRLLEEIVKRGEQEQSLKCCFIDLKKVNGTLEEHIERV